MKIFKSTCMFAFALLIIFMVSGCQKDSVSSNQREETHTESTSAKQNAKEISKTHQSKTETNNTETSTSKNKSETAPQKSAEKSEKSNSSQSKSTVVKKQASESAKTNATPKTNSTSTATSKPSTNENKNTNQSTAKTPTKAPEPALTVTISIVSHDLNKTILSPTKVSIQNGDTFLSATRTILKQKGIPISVRGSGASAYVEGIGDLYEFDHGPLSGWIAEKNGVKLDRSAGIKSLKSGDTIRWIYTTDYTKGQ